MEQKGGGIIRVHLLISSDEPVFRRHVTYNISSDPHNYPHFTDEKTEAPMCQTALLFIAKYVLL